MRALLDINVLLALMDNDHIHHRRALAWWRSERKDGWASCPITQNGFVRILSQQTYPGHLTPAQAIEQLRLQLAESTHEFWPDDISIADDRLFDRTQILGPKQLTDVYLLVLAIKHGGRLVTFDRSVPIAAARGLQPGHLVVM